MMKTLLDVFFVVFCWVAIVVCIYEAQAHINNIKNQDLKIIADTIFYSASAVIVTLAFVAEYLKK